MEDGGDLIDAVLAKVQKDPLAVDFQISLFMSAVSSYRHDSVLRPFPPGFLYENGEKNIDSLFDKITKKTENSSKSPTPLYIFEIKYSDSSNAKFSELCQEMDVLYGYHGSSVENFHSIIHNGLHAHLNKTSVFGKGTYLSSDLNVSILYSKFGKGWKGSLLGEKMSCIAVCEIIDHPDVKRAVTGPRGRSRSRAENSEAGDVPERYFVVTNNQFVRVKYILVYPSRSGPKMFVKSVWIFQHPLASLVIVYILCLLLLGLSRTNMFQQFYKKLKKS